MTTRKKVTKKKVAKKKVTKKKIGRPTKYKPEYCEYLVNHLSMGLSYETFGAALPDYDKDLEPVYGCVSKQTVYDWEKAHKDFLDAKKRGWEQCQLFWEREGKKGMWGGKQFVSPVWIFNMKNRFNWTDKTEVKTEDTQKEKKTFAFDLSEKPKV